VQRIEAVHRRVGAGESIGAGESRALERAAYDSDPYLVVDGNLSKIRISGPLCRDAIHSEHYRMPVEIISSLVSTFATVLGVVAASFAVYSVWRGSASASVRGLEAEVEQVRRRISEPPEAAETADKQYLLLREYHAQGLAQSKVSFWFSLIFAALGFAVIVSAIFTLQPREQLLNQGRTFISLVAGTVIDAVAALFFVQSNKARQLMVDFFDRLRKDRKLEEALRLALEIPDAELRNRVYTLLSLSFAEIKLTDVFLASLLDIREPRLIAGEASAAVESRLESDGADAE
jgi:hypothetical protein